MPLNSAGNFGGPRYGWGDAPGGHAQRGNGGLDRGRYAGSPEAGLHRGERQWGGRGPSAQQSYGWDYQGGVGRDEITRRSEARMGSPFQARPAQERGGGLPRGRYAVDYDRSSDHGGGNDVRYDWGWQGRGGGMNPGSDHYGSGFRPAASPRYGATNQRYGNDFRGGSGASGGWMGGGGDRQMGGYGALGGWTGSGAMQSRVGSRRDFSAGHDRPRDGGFSGGYGARDGGMRGRSAGRYGGDYNHPLSDTEFYRRVERW
jgi:hypothetical protein